MTPCTCPRLDGYIIHRQDCSHRPERALQAAPALEVVSDPDADDAACAWSDYRKDYGASGAREHRAFLAGWKAAREGDQAGVLR